MQVGNLLIMKIRKVINRPIHSKGKGINIVGGVTGAVSANVNESGGSRVISRQKVHVVQTSEKKNKPNP
jgi:hypothetical protein